MPVIVFMPRFHDLVATGAKRQTIREPRKRPIKPGDPLSLRAWEGRPYRSKQRVLRESDCLGVCRVRLSAEPEAAWPFRVDLDGDQLSLWAIDDFAKDDGFAGRLDMAAFWAEHRYLPFEGVVIYWR